jgi:5-methyltetrahydropteroyltriglutamate--homocysteine methyltransferase
MPWLALAAQMLIEVDAFAKALVGQKDEAFFAANAAVQASRRASPRVTDKAVQKAISSVKFL